MDGPKEITLTIVFDPQGRRVQVTGPLDNTVLCLGMLAEAGRIIQRRADQRDAEAETTGPARLTVPVPITS